MTVILRCPKPNAGDRWAAPSARWSATTAPRRPIFRCSIYFRAFRFNHILLVCDDSPGTQSRSRPGTCVPEQTERQILISNIRTRSYRARSKRSPTPNRPIANKSRNTCSRLQCRFPQPKASRIPAAIRTLDSNNLALHD